MTERTDCWLSRQFREEHADRSYVIPRDGENGPELFIQSRNPGTGIIPLTDADLWSLLTYAAQTLRRRQARKAAKVQERAGADD